MIYIFKFKLTLNKQLNFDHALFILKIATFIFNVLYVICRTTYEVSFLFNQVYQTSLDNILITLISVSTFIRINKHLLCE